MKLPRNFGGQGFGGAMKQMQDAMAQAQSLEDNLKNERINVDKGPVKALFDGTGMVLKIQIDKSVVDPEDVEALEDLIVSVVRDGFDQAVEMRSARVQSILPNLPNIPGL